jgi:Dyp-type peroxidase family
MTTLALSRPQAGVPRAAHLAEPVTLDLADIQSFVLYPVAFPFARFSFWRVPTVEAGRRFVDDLVPMVTNAVHSGRPHDDRKASEVTVAFTHDGLAAVGVPARSLASFSPEFQDGMQARAVQFLADYGASHPDGWERGWEKGAIHIWIAVQTTDIPDPANPLVPAVSGRATLEDVNQRIVDCAVAAGVILVGTQEAGALIDPDTKSFTDREHFGYADGFGNPDIAGCGWPAPAGSGKADGKGGWAPIAAGEFLLGTPDEAGEMPVAPVPIGLARNGTYLAYRKLHENVASFRHWLRAESEHFPGGAELLAAKLVGRFRDGTPLERSPDKPMGYTFMQRLDPAIIPELTNFTFAADTEGVRCPMGAHIRRVNPRDSLGFNGVLVDRRRIIRRGLPYGASIPEAMPLDEVQAMDACDADHESRHGVIFMALNASLERQFEFIQHEWVNYGNDFRQGNDRDPLLGNREGEDRMIIQSNPDDPEAAPPHFCTGLPQFVTTRGGEYFFVPGIAALRLIAAGSVEIA